MATIIEFFVPKQLQKKGYEVDTSGRTWEGDSVQPATKEVGLTPHRSANLAKGCCETPKFGNWWFEPVFSR
jgi:hypothetical protein